MLPLLIASLIAAGPGEGAADPTGSNPACPATTLRCVGVRLFVATDDIGAPVVDDAFVATQLAEANRHFAPTGVGFALADVALLPAGSAHIATRAERDALGRARWERGTIAVFIVARLDDVDEDGQIRGVHWRDRAARAHRWVIVSGIAGDYVLAHELGHFFGLPHSTEAISIMNKTPRAEPPPETRTFSTREVRRMKARARAMIRDGTLVPITERSTP